MFGAKERMEKRKPLVPHQGVAEQAQPKKELFSRWQEGAESWGGSGESSPDPSTSPSRTAPPLRALEMENNLISPRKTRRQSQVSQLATRRTPQRRVPTNGGSSVRSLSRMSNQLLTTWPSKEAEMQGIWPVFLRFLAVKRQTQL